MNRSPVRAGDVPPSGADVVVVGAGVVVVGAEVVVVGAEVVVVESFGSLAEDPSSLPPQADTATSTAIIEMIKRTLTLPPKPIPPTGRRIPADQGAQGPIGVTISCRRSSRSRGR